MIHFKYLEKFEIIMREIFFSYLNWDNLIIKLMIFFFILFFFFFFLILIFTTSASSLE
jgi:hypothetical protein